MSSLYAGYGNNPTSQGYARIAIASSTNANPIQVTTQVNHGMQSGDTVVIEGHATNTNANGRWIATVTSSTTFTIPVAGNGVGVATGFAIDYEVLPNVTIPSDGDAVAAASVNGAFKGLADIAPFLYERVGFQRLFQTYFFPVIDDAFANYSTTTPTTVTSATVSTTSGNLVTPITVTTTASHNYIVGDTVRVTGVVGNTAVNGTWVLQTVPAANQFTVNATGNGAYSSGGACTRSWQGLSNLTNVMSFTAPTPNPSVNFNDVLEVIFEGTAVIGAAGVADLGLGLSLGGGAALPQPIAGSMQQMAASFSGGVNLHGLIQIGSIWQPLNSGQNNQLFNLSVMALASGGAPSINFNGPRMLLVRHLRPN